MLFPAVHRLSPHSPSTAWNVLPSSSHSRNGMASLATRFKSAFNPSSRQPQQPSAPTPILTMSVPVLSYQKGDEDFSPIETLTSTGVRFSPEHHGSGDGKTLRVCRPKQSYATPSPRSRRRTEYGQRRENSTSALDFVRVPSFPGIFF